MDNNAIQVESLNKSFRLPHEKQSSIKGIFVNIFKGKGYYEKQKALTNITFNVKRGDFFGIVGRNGSGKSTLLKLLAGIYSPDSGAIQVDGKLIPFIELGVGFNPELTGRENVFLNSALLGFNRREVKAMYDDIVEFSELKRFMDQKLKNYSSGMQVRLAFSIAIRARGDILLLDEVLAVGDAAFQQKCYNYFAELKEQNKTVILVTHDMSAVRRFCTKAINIEGGKITHYGDPADITDIYIQENMESPQRAKDKKDNVKTEKKHTIATKISKQTDDEITFQIDYWAKNIKDKMYVGISVTKDAISIAEMTTDLRRPLSGKGRVNYVLDTSILNGGVYAISGSLFKLRNRELVAVCKESSFVIKGSDITRGAAIKLGDTWEYK